MNNIDKRVTLKPIFNIKPQIYIPVLYGVLLLVVVFFIFFISGFFKRDSYLNITSSPSNASVFIDDIRVGSTPFKALVKSDIKKIELRKQNFIDYSFNLLEKDDLKHHIVLKSDNGLEILNNAYREASKWSLINTSDINSRYRIPPTLSSAVTDYYYSSDFNKDTLHNFIKSSIKLITGEYILSDYLKAIMIVSSDNRLPSISSIKKSALLINEITTERKNSPLLFYNRILRNDEININNDLYQKLNDNHRKILNKNVTYYDEAEKDIKIDNMVFINIPSSNIVPTDINFIHNIKEDSFYILDSLISKENYYNFIEDNPIWGKMNINNLINDGLVDKYYLDFSNEEEYITNISYYAADAWCRWANNEYNVPTGWKITLLDENRWFSALQYNVIEDNVAWQWTDKGFYLYDHFLTDKDGKTMKAFTEITPRVVVGKNKYNNKAESGIGVQNADWCTPFIGFRPILVKE